uniref:Serine/threonine-protein kinase n=1 Tax=Macrostomum lignano TaxID=282301 RepID=A0A1I8FBX9_9PLAT
PPATSSHARQASDLSQLTIDTGTSGDIRMATTPPRPTRPNRVAARCRTAKATETMPTRRKPKMKRREELPPIPSALERTLKLRKSGFEELGLVIAAGGKGTKRLRGDGSPAGQRGPLAAAPSSQATTSPPSIPSRCVAWTVIYIPRRDDAEVHLQSMQFATDRKPKSSLPTSRSSDCRENLEILKLETCETGAILTEY